MACWHTGVKPRRRSSLSLATIAPSHAPGGATARIWELYLALAAGCLLALALMAPQAWSVWSRGTFLDPDDAMRAVEVRDFLAGQGWFDLVPRRLSSDHPFVMHWSRLVDAPLALAESLLGRVMTADTAERVTRLVEPAALFVATLVTMLRLARRLAGPRTMLPASCLLATSFELVTNFLPGHIHHHGLQVTLLLTSTAALLASFGPTGRAGMAGSAALAAVLSLGVGLQNLPFVLGLIAASIATWIVSGRAAHLRSFGIGLFGAVPVFLVDVPPSTWGQGACDAFSSAHLVGCSGMAAVCLLLAAMSPRLLRRRDRGFAALGGCVVVVGVLALRFPVCLGDPMAGVDPLLRTEWLSGVGEALPLARLLALSPWDGAALALTLAGGLAATLGAACRAQPGKQGGWAALLLLGAIGLAGSLWQVRVAASACALFVPGLAVAVLAAFDHLSRTPGRPALLIAVLVGLLGNGAAWSALSAPLKRITAPAWPSGPAGGTPSDCFEPANFAPLASLPAGLVLSTIDPGATILAYTAHSVLAAPYHRNSFGNRVSLLSLAAPPDVARPMIQNARVRYLALCRFSGETVETVRLHPDSLSAALLTGRTPRWLDPVETERGAYLLFAVRDVQN